MEKDRFIHFALLIGGVNKHLQRIKIDNATEIGIKGVHAFWLYELSAHPEGMTASELASHAMIDRSLISREIALLKRNAIVEMEGETGKRGYNVKIRLTERGRALAARIGELALQYQREIDRDIGEEELAGFYVTLEKLYRNFARVSGEAPAQASRNNND